MVAQNIKALNKWTIFYDDAYYPSSLTTLQKLFDKYSTETIRCNLSRNDQAWL